jgi:hypothetical protein
MTLALPCFRSSASERLLRLKWLNFPESWPVFRAAAERAQQIPLRRFHLDHVSTVIGEAERGRWADHDAGEVDDAHARKGAAAHCPTETFTS